MTMDAERFRALAAAGYNRIPLQREILADLDTPLSAYLKLAEGPYSYLFESVHGGEKWGRYSMIGLPARTQLKVYDHEITVLRDGEVIEQTTADDPLQWLEEFQAQFHVPEIDHLPRFSGGLVGYFGYDTVRYIEPRLAQCPNPDPLGVPDILLMVSDEIVIFDNLSGKLYIIVHVDPTDNDALTHGQQRLEAIAERLRNARPTYPSEHPSLEVEEKDFTSTFSQAGYMEAVERIKDYIIEGDVMQAVPSQRMSIRYESAPLDIYRALRSLNPSPYMFYFDFDDFHVVGSSPEILVRLEDNEVTVRPIAGTRPRGTDEKSDKRLQQDLLADPKELAEHLMLIDLGRNDVGRVSATGSVKVTEQMVIERYSHVMHIVSNVVGELRDGMSALDVLRATFPAGTVSGAPKIRAMEIIDELEPVKRGIYAGAVGYLSWNGNMDTAIAIRTAVIKDKTLHIQAGGGIVADSVPATEWEETLNKRRAMFRAVMLAEQGLHRLN